MQLPRAHVRGGKTKQDTSGVDQRQTDMHHRMNGLDPSRKGAVNLTGTGG